MPKQSKYDIIVTPQLEHIRTQRINGASIEDIAKWLGVSASTIYGWMRKHEAFGKAMKDAEVQLHSKIESVANYSLLDKLIDRMMTTEQIIEDGVVVKEKRQLVKADTTAIIFALKARNPQKWEPLGVARLEESEQDAELGQRIVDALEKYKPKHKETNKHG